MKKMMVLFAVLILTCLMAFGALAEDIIATPVPPEAGQQVTGLKTVFDGVGIVSSAFDDHQAYILDDDGMLWLWDYSGEPVEYCALPVYSLQQGYYDTTGEELRQLEDAVFDLFAEDGVLYALNPYSGRVGTVDSEGVHWMAEFDSSALIASYGWAYWVEGAAIHDGVAYILASREEHGTQVVRIDLISGAVNLFDAPDANNLCVQGDRLLLICMPWNAAEMMAEETYIVAMNPASGEITRLPYVLPVKEDWSMGLGATEDAVYLLTNGVFYISRDGENFEALQQGPDYAGGMRILPKGGVAYTGMGISVCPLAENPATEKLVVRGNGFMSEIKESFIAAHPEALLQLMDGSVDAVDVADRIRGGDKETDVFVVRVDAAFGTLVEKGFVTPLGDNPVIAASAEKLFPVFRSALTDSQGRLVAYPDDLNITTWGYNPQIWPDYFSEDELPSTYLEMFQMMKAFLEKDDGDYFFDMYDYATMVKHVIDAYLTAHGDETVFHNDALKETLGLLEDIQKSLRERRLESWDVYEMFSELDDSRHCLLWWTEAYSDHRSDMGQNDHDFFVTVDGEPAYRSYLYALIVNPLSERKELAKEFVAIFAQPDMSPVRYAVLHTDGKPAKRINWQGEEVDMVTVEALAEWNEVVQNLRFGEHDKLMGGKMSEQIDAAIARYVGGQMTLEQMLGQLDEVAKMILSE